MRIQYSPSIFVFLSVLITISACQGDAHRLHMDSNGSHATGTSHVKEERRLALAPFTALVSRRPDTHTQNGNDSLLLPASSNGLQGALAPTEPSVQALQQHSTASTAKPIKEIVPRQDEKKEETSQASPGLTDWFQRFVDAIDHAKEWVEVAGVLAEGRRCGYLDKSVVWDDDQYTPLHYAAEEGNLKVVKELVEKDNIPVDVITDGRGRTPLQFSASAGHLQIVEFLVKRGAVISHTDKQRSNALHYAAAGCDELSIAVIDFLTASSAEDANIICSRARDRFSVLTLALHAANIHLAKHLINNYPQIVPLQDSEEGIRLLRCAELINGEVKSELKRAMAAKKS